MACSGFHFLIVWLPILKEDIGKVELGIDERIQNGEKGGGGWGGEHDELMSNDIINTL